MIVPSSVLGLNGKTAPSNRIVLGGIGLGPRGRKVLSSFFEYKDCQFIAIADPQKERREIIKRLTDRNYKNKDCVPARLNMSAMKHGLKLGTTS